ncbi:hypothetical protein [Arthrobacter sp. NPDC058192]|uniref:hypothetical protein n=1 Tax=Arthrobacter sp. NPDC058192 TaxID=3346372 RepID=UPI0036F133A7
MLALVEVGFDVVVGDVDPAGFQRPVDERLREDAVSGQFCPFEQCEGLLLAIDVDAVGPVLCVAVGDGTLGGSETFEAEKAQVSSFRRDARWVDSAA